MVRGRGTVAQWLIPALALALLLVPSTLAAEGSVAYLSAAGEAELYGSFSAEQPQGRIFGMLQDPSAGPILVGKDLQVLEVRYVLDLETYGYERQSREYGVDGNQLQILGPATFRLDSDGPIAARSQGDGAQARLYSASPLDPQQVMVAEEALELAPAGTYTAFEPMGSATGARGNFTLWMMEGQATTGLSGTNIPPAGGKYLYRSSLLDRLAGESGPTHYQLTVLRIRIADGSYAFAPETNSGDRNILLSGERSPLTVRVDGTVVFQNARGVAVIDDKATEVDGESLVVEGRMTLTPSNAMVDPNNPASRRTDYKLEGSLDGLQVGSGPYQSYAPYVAGGFLAVLAAAVTWLWPTLKFYGAKLPGLLLYAKVDKDEVLENTVRGEIYTYIKENPGVNVGGISRHFTNGWGTIVYHLTVLERNRYVTAVRDGRHKRFFPVGLIDRSKMDQFAILANPTTQKVFDEIQGQPGIIQVALAKEMGISAPAVKWHVSRLVAAGMVEQVKDGRRILYVPAGMLQNS